MENPNLYSVANGVQRKDAEELLMDCRPLLSKINQDSEVIDIGSGDGYVTAHILRRYLPKQINGLIGVDRSEDMVEFGNSEYKDSVLQFMTMDLNEELDKQLCGKFNLVTSFYCLHWVQDQKGAFNKIYNLLDNNGIMLFCQPTAHAIYEAYNIFKNDPKWRHLFKDVNKYLSPYNQFKDPAAECRRIMEKTGFRNISVENQTKVFTYNSLKQFKDFFTALSPYIKLLDNSMAKEYIEDMMKIFENSPTIDIKYGENNQIVAVSTTYKLMIGHGIK